MSKQITLRQITLDDLSRVSEIHLAAFPHSALAKLGLEATRRTYEWKFIGPHPQVIALGCEFNSELNGFCFGGRFHGAMIGFLRRNWSFLIWRVISRPRLLLDKTFRGRSQFGLGYLVTGCLPNRSNRLQRTNDPDKMVFSPDLQSFGILSIAVHPDYQGFGLGKALIVEAERIAVHENYPIMHLTVNVSNYQAIRFYENQGWSKVPNDETWSGKMVKLLSTITLKK